MLAADQRRKRPRQVPRPDHVKRRAGQASPSGVKHAVSVLKATQVGVVRQRNAAEAANLRAGGPATVSRGGR